MEVASFSFHSSTTPALKSINIRIPSANLTVVTGPTGSGKSALLEALLGELVCVEGRLAVESRCIGYCAQYPWLPAATIKDVILAANYHEEAWYRDVLYACMLDQDLCGLPDNDQTLVGNKGTKLSGGQKQRVALARAIYSRPKVLLLDDIFSGLDSHTEHTVTTRVLGVSGICAKYQMTIVLATHSPQSLKLADSVIFMDEGTAVQQFRGSDESTIQLERIPNVNTGPSPGSSTKPGATNGDPDTNTVTGDDLALTEDSSRQTGDTRVYAYYAKAVGWPLSLAILLSNTVIIFGMKFPDIWLKWWSEDERAHPGQRTWLYIGVNIGLAVCALLSVVIMLLFLFILAVPQASTRIHKRLLDTVMEAPYSFFASTAAGITLNRFSQDMTLIDTQLPRALMQTLDGALICVGELILIAIVSQYMAILAPFLIVLLYFLQKYYLHTSRQMRLLDLEAKSPLYSNFLEAQSGVVTIRAFGWQRAWKDRNIKLLDDSQRPFYLLYCIQRWLNLVLDLVVAAFAVVVMTLATQLDHGVGGGSLGVAFINILSFSSSLAYLITAWTQLETSIGAIARVRSFEASTPSEAREGDVQIPPHTWPDKGAIEFSDLSAGYNSSEPTLRHISMHIQPGEKIGVCGRTGSGKSSMLLTLLQMIHTHNGTLTIDGINLSSIQPNTLRSNLITIPQDSPPLPGTVRFNADPSSSFASDTPIEDALSRVGLWQLIRTRGGLHAEMSTLRLSSGQAQLFALVRAILLMQRRQAQFGNESATVLLLDEVTANVDAETEKRMIDVLNGETFRGLTVLAVAHRLKTIVGMDRVVVLDKGRVVECGRPEELLGVEGSLFRGMFETLA